MIIPTNIICKFYFKKPRKNYVWHFKKKCNTIKNKKNQKESTENVNTTLIQLRINNISTMKTKKISKTIYKLCNIWIQILKLLLNSGNYF